VARVRKNSGFVFGVGQEKYARVLALGSGGGEGVGGGGGDGGSIFNARLPLVVAAAGPLFWTCFLSAAAVDRRPGKYLCHVD